MYTTVITWTQNNVSSYSLSDEEIQVLKLGLTFRPNSHMEKLRLIKYIHLFARRLMYKVLYVKPDLNPPFQHDLLTIQENMDECRALEDLMDLWEEGHVEDDIPW